MKKLIAKVDYQLFCLREGTRQVEMLAFPFAAAREPAKLAERVLLV